MLTTVQNYSKAPRSPQQEGFCTAFPGAGTLGTLKDRNAVGDGRLKEGERGWEKRK